MTARPSTPPMPQRGAQAAAGSSSIAAAARSSGRKPYYSSIEVAEHNVMSDCWVSYFGNVYDLTKLVQENKGLLVQPLLKFAGQDITHWFDPKTKEPKTRISPSTGVREPFTPYGRFLHIPPTEPTADWDNSFETAWWHDPALHVGNLSKRRRKIRIINLLSGQAAVLSVCCEETLSEIRDRYLAYNAHAYSYTWKRLGRVLSMDLTLEENGVEEQSDEFATLNMDEDEYIPALHVHFNDDLTVQ